MPIRPRTGTTDARARAARDSTTGSTASHRPRDPRPTPMPTGCRGYVTERRRQLQGTSTRGIFPAISVATNRAEMTKSRSRSIGRGLPCAERRRQADRRRRAARRTSRGRRRRRRTCAMFSVIERRRAGHDSSARRSRRRTRSSGSCTSKRSARASDFDADDARIRPRRRTDRRRDRRPRPRLGVRPVLRRRARVLAAPQPRRPGAERPAETARPRLGQPRPPHLPLLAASTSRRSSRMLGEARLRLPRAVLRRRARRAGARR